MKKIFVMILISFILLGCNNTSGKLDFKKIMSENEYTIIDVRTKEEYELSHIVDAINIPYDEIDKNISLDKNKIIFVYCRSGARSEIAFKILSNLGYEVYDLGAFSQIDLEKE